jgi:hypothetical protein
MTIPLWLPWAVVAALAIPALLATGTTDQPGVGPLRTLARRWAAALVALVVAGVLTADRVNVAEDELFDSVERASARLDGSLGGVTTERLAVTVADDLGRDVSVEEGEAATQDEIETVYSYDVRVDGQDDGPVACVRVTVSDLGGESASQTWVTLFAEHDACGES